MNDMELKLQELYGNYTKLDNGTYYVKTKNGNEIYIPETISQNQSMIAYAPGSGGFSNSYQRFKELYSTDNPPNCVTVHPFSYSESVKFLMWLFVVQQAVNQRQVFSPQHI